MNSEKLYLNKLACLGLAYSVDDLLYRNHAVSVLSKSAAIRQIQNHRFAELCSLSLGETSQESYTAKGKEVQLEESDSISSPDYKEAARLKSRLEHEFRKELECPVATRTLSKTAYHIYLQLAQEEVHAAKKRAFAFTLTREFSNRRNILDAIRKAGFRVHYTVGCKIARFNDPSFPAYTGKVRKDRRAVASKTKAPGQASGDSPELVLRPQMGKRGPCRRYMETPIEEKVPRAFTHLHGLAVPLDPAMANPMGKLRSILQGSFLKRISAANPLRMAPKQKGKTAAVAEGLLSYAIYMAKNYDQPCPVKGLRRFGISGTAQRLTKIQKRDLHPQQTKAELDAYRKAKEEIRVQLRRPLRGRQTWAYRHRKLIRSLIQPPVYTYPATAILRDGFSYEIRPEWGSWIIHQTFSPYGTVKDKNRELIDEDIFGFIPCEFSRNLVWQEHEDDFFRQAIGQNIRDGNGDLTKKGLSQIAAGIRNRDGKLTNTSLLLREEGILERDGTLSAKANKEFRDGLRFSDGRLTKLARGRGMKPKKWTEDEVSEITERTIYDTHAGECELELILHLSRFPRVIEIGESPGCPIFRYHSYTGTVRPHADKLLASEPPGDTHVQTGGEPPGQ